MSIKQRAFFGDFVRRNWRTFFILISLLTDVSSIFVAGWGAFYIKHLIPRVPAIDTLTLIEFAILFSSVLIFVAAVLGLYRASFRVTLRQQRYLAAKAYVYSVLLTFAASYVIPFPYFPKRFTLLFFVLLPFSFLAVRSLLDKFNAIMRERGYGIHNTIILGTDGITDQFVERIWSYPELGYSLKDIIVPNARKKKRNSVEESTGRLVLTNEIIEVEQLITEMQIERIFISSLDEMNRVQFLMGLCRKYRVKLKLLSVESEDLLRFVHVNDIAGIPLYSPPRKRTDNIKRVAKRAFDFLGALTAIVILSPLLLLSALAILLEDGRPVFFTQRRALVKGTGEFQMLKFRSMTKDAEQQQQEMYKLNRASGGLFLLDNDPRLTRVGRILRKFSIDELPQLFNVLKGDMSLVGPRPLSIADLSNVTPENQLDGYYTLRAHAKPGMTGLWQISGRREVNFREMILLDLYYLDNQSFLFDVEILFATIPAVLYGRGAY